MAPKQKGPAPPASDGKRAQSVVPATFWLAGTQWKVERVAHLADLGCCLRDEATIRIRAGLPHQVDESTFCHELMHAIKFTMGLDAEKHDEQEVDAMGSLLHQFMLTRAD